MYTGIGRRGYQDSIENNMYDLNAEVLSHKEDASISWYSKRERMARCTLLESTH